MPRHPLCALNNLTKNLVIYPALKRGMPFLSTSRLYFYLPYAIVKEQIPLTREIKISKSDIRNFSNSGFRDSSLPCVARNIISGKIHLPFFAKASQGMLHSPLRYERGMVGVPGVEPGTSSLSGTRSNQLSYTPFCAPPRGASKGKPRLVTSKVACLP